MEGAKINGNILPSLRWQLRGLELLKKYFQDDKNEVGAKFTQAQIDELTKLIALIERDIQKDMEG